MGSRLLIGSIDLMEGLGATLGPLLSACDVSVEAVEVLAGVADVVEIDADVANEAVPVEVSDINKEASDFIPTQSLDKAPFKP